jgi:hypothetical protein
MTTLRSPHPSPLTVLIDDSRGFRDERPALVARSSQEALSLLEALKGRWIDHLWLDHDLGGDDTVRPVVDLMVQLASTGSPLNVGQIHIHTANVGAGHQMGVDLRAAGYAVVRSYSRGKHAAGKVFWQAQTSNIAIVNQLRAMAVLPSNVHNANGAVAERALRLVTDEDEPTALDRAWGLRDQPQP